MTKEQSGGNAIGKMERKKLRARESWAPTASAGTGESEFEEREREQLGRRSPGEILAPWPDDIEPPMSATGGKTGILLPRDRTVVCPKKHSITFVRSV
ncbi:hypothetical protein NG799_09785 [Laspinema sp. D1]|uniref:Uncharacterized protein n=1 Tax=Laspinema palackyanum D2a TaxID=2953684 RepID=A0ABT2MT66_9CYAN|nr:hypothetical protein [Laspinema sp. D2a]